MYNGMDYPKCGISSTPRLLPVQERRAESFMDAKFRSCPFWSNGILGLTISKITKPTLEKAKLAIVHDLVFQDFGTAPGYSDYSI